MRSKSIKFSVLFIGGMFSTVLAISGAMAQTPIFTSIHEGQVVTEAFPIIEGTSKPYANIQVGYRPTSGFVNAKSVNTNANASGKWSISNFFLRNGLATLQVSDSMERTIVNVTVNAPPVIKPFTVNELPSHTVSGTTFFNNPLFRGTGNAGATITLEDVGTNKAYGSGTIEPDGTFAVAPGDLTRLPEGPVMVRVKESTRGQSKDFSLVVNTSVAQFTNPTEGAVVIDNGQITFTGTSAPHLPLQIFDRQLPDGIFLASTTADASGRWYATFSRSGPDKYSGNASLQVRDQFTRGSVVNIVWK